MIYYKLLARLSLSLTNIRHVSVKYACIYNTSMSSCISNNQIRKIGTHDGVFHCDEVLACFMLKLLYENAEIVRSRNASILNSCDIVVDVGGVYDVNLRRFDHHQAGFQHTMNSLLDGKPWKVKLSSAGLVYVHYGMDILKKVTNNDKEQELLNYVFDRVYENLIQEIDGTDNGIPMFPQEPLYTINTSLSDKIRHLNKPWNQDDDSYDVQKAFQQAIDICGNEFLTCINRVIEISYPAKKIVENAIVNRYTIHESGEIIELDVACPWKEHFFKLEQQMQIKPEIKYVIFQSEENHYRVQAVSLNHSSFVLRLPLPQQWRGQRDENLCEISKIQGSLFVHSNGFIGGNKTREGAIQMAIKSLQYSDNNL